MKNIKIIKDLGFIYAKHDSKTKRHYLIIECVVCKTDVRTEKRYITSGKHLGRCYSCANKENSVKHGMYYTKLYRTLRGIKARCLNSNSAGYKNYGGRGILICDEWRDDVKKFYDWAISNGYSDDLSIDRINNDGNYEPSNCRWTTRSVQTRNTRRIYKSNTSGYRGVSFNVQRGKFTASIRINGKGIYLGRFKTALEAATVYDKYVKEYNLEHTCNFS